MDVPELLAAVEREFAITGADTPPWPDPRPDRREPRDEEYSRLTDPGKYRIVATRAEAWSRALAALGLATRDAVTDPAHVWDGSGDRAHPAARAWWVRPRATGTVPLLFALRDIEAPDTHLGIGAGEPPRLVEDVPDCGCDACDSGSADLLTVVDDAVLDVVTGALVHVRLGATTAIAGRDRWQAGSRDAAMARREDIDAAIAAVRAGTWRAEDGPALHGAPWY